MIRASINSWGANNIKVCTFVFFIQIPLQDLRVLGSLNSQILNCIEMHFEMFILKLSVFASFRPINLSNHESFRALKLTNLVTTKVTTNFSFQSLAQINKQNISYAKYCIYGCFHSCQT